MLSNDKDSTVEIRPALVRYKAFDNIITVRISDKEKNKAITVYK